MSERKRALIAYVNCSRGGVGSVIADRVRWFIELGYGVDCAFVNNNGAAPLFYEAGADRVYHLGTSLEKYASDLVLRNQYAVVSLFSHFSATHRFGVGNAKIIWEVHGSHPPALTALGKISYKGVSKVVVPSNWLKSELCRYAPSLGSLVEIVHNAVDIYGERSELLGRPEANPPRPLLWVGRIGEQHKNWRDAVEIAAYIARKYHSYPIFVLSLKRDNESMKEFFHELQQNGVLLKSKIFYNLSRNELMGLYAEVARVGGIFYSTSIAESFGLAIQEAAIAGLPTVLRPGSAISELCEDGRTSVFAGQGSVYDYIRAIEKLLRNYELYGSIVAAGAENARRFSTVEIQPVFNRLVHQLVSH